MSQPKLLLFGASGHLGSHIAAALKATNYYTIAVVRSKEKGEKLKPFINEYKIADVLNPGELKGICQNVSVVISALGKSVSPNSKDKPGFYEVDFKGNENILTQAIESGVQKFVYVSALGAESHKDLTYFKVHHLFSEKLKASGINYSILQPPAMFSAFIDLIEMAKKGRLVQIGKGDKKTNPIYDGDLAKVCVEAIGATNSIYKAGGQTIYTRRQITEMIQQTVAPAKKLRTIPTGLVKLFLPLLKLVDKNQYDKFSFFIEVLQEDTIADKTGPTTLEQYLSNYVNR